MCADYDNHREDCCDDSSFPITHKDLTSEIRESWNNMSNIFNERAMNGEVRIACKIAKEPRKFELLDELLQSELADCMLKTEKFFDHSLAQGRCWFIRSMHYWWSLHHTVFDSHKLRISSHRQFLIHHYIYQFIIYFYAHVSCSNNDDSYKLKIIVILFV